MKDFIFSNPTRIIFGHSAYDFLISELKNYPIQKLLIHFGGNFAKKSGLLKNLEAMLDDNSIPYIELGGVMPNPRLSLVEKGIQLCKKEGVNFILAVGGGSVIDSAKAIAAGCCLSKKENLWDYYMDNSKTFSSCLPLGVVLTIPATGSESSKGSVITNEKTQAKRSAECDSMIPKFALLNPEITYSLPPYQTACGAADIMSHMMERYFTQVSNTDLTDRLLEGAMRSILYNAPIAMQNPADYNSRAEIMWTGTIAHNGLLDTGRIGDWGSHMIEHEVSGIYNIAHGAGLSIIFPAWMKYVYHENIPKFIQFSHRVFDIDLDYASPENTILEMIQRLENFFSSLNLPIQLSQIGIDHSRFQEMAEKALINRPFIGHFKKLYKDDIISILQLAL